jgi:hypothetical protein
MCFCETDFLSSHKSVTGSFPENHLAIVLMVQKKVLRADLPAAGECLGLSVSGNHEIPEYQLMDSEFPTGERLC